MSKPFLLRNLIIMASETALIFINHFVFRFFAAAETKAICQKVTAQNARINIEANKFGRVISQTLNHQLKK